MSSGQSYCPFLYTYVNVRACVLACVRAGIKKVALMLIGSIKCPYCFKKKTTFKKKRLKRRIAADRYRTQNGRLSANWRYSLYILRRDILRREEKKEN